MPLFTKKSRKKTAGDMIPHQDKVTRLRGTMHKTQQKGGEPLEELEKIEPEKTVMESGAATLAKAGVVAQTNEIVAGEFLRRDYVVHDGTRSIEAALAGLGQTRSTTQRTS